jgi:hypothetical protein
MLRSKKARAAILMQVTEFTAQSVCRDFPILSLPDVQAQLALLIKEGKVETVARLRGANAHGTVTIYTVVRTPLPKDPEKHLARLMGTLRYDSPRPPHLLPPAQPRNPDHRPHMQRLP